MMSICNPKIIVDEQRSKRHIASFQIVIFSPRCEGVKALSITVQAFKDISECLQKSQTCKVFHLTTIMTGVNNEPSEKCVWYCLPKFVNTFASR